MALHEPERRHPQQHIGRARLALGWGAERLSTRTPSEHFTYGFGRSTQLAALINGVLVAMAWAAAAGIAVNLGSASMFGHGGHHHDLNRRAAILHLLSDALVALTAHPCRKDSGMDDLELLHSAKEALAEIGVQHRTLQLEPG